MSFTGRLEKPQPLTACELYKMLTGWPAVLVELDGRRADAGTREHLRLAICDRLEDLLEAGEWMPAEKMARNLIKFTREEIQANWSSR